MTSAFNWVIAFIIVQTVAALLALIWALRSGQFRDMERQGRRVFHADLEAGNESPMGERPAADRG